MDTWFFVGKGRELGRLKKFFFFSPHKTYLCAQDEFVHQRPAGLAQAVEDEREGRRMLLQVKQARQQQQTVPAAGTMMASRHY